MVQWLDWVCSMWKFSRRIHGTNFWINCTSSAHFAPSFMQQRNDSKCTQTLQNAVKHEFRVEWGGSSAFIAKILTQLRGTNFYNNCTSSAHFTQSFMQQWNDPKCTQTIWTGPKHGFRVQWGWSSAFVVKIPTRLCGTNFCSNYTSSAHFAQSFMQ